MTEDVTKIEGKEMTKAERGDLLSIAKKNERVAIDECDVRAAQLKTDFENHISAVYSWDQTEKWAQVYAKGREYERAANEDIMNVCTELGIPAQFAPSISVSWSRRGENFTAARRAEIRRAAYAQIDEWAKTAKHVIRTKSAQTQVSLLARGLTTAVAHEFLATMPTPEQLMPQMTMEEAKKFLKMESAQKIIEREQEKLESKELNQRLSASYDY